MLHDSKEQVITFHDFRVTCSYDEILRFKRSATSATNKDSELTGIMPAVDEMVQGIGDNTLQLSSQHQIMFSKWYGALAHLTNPVDLKVVAAMQPTWHAHYFAIAKEVLTVVTFIQNLLKNLKKNSAFLIFFIYKTFEYVVKVHMEWFSKFCECSIIIKIYKI